MSNILLLAGAYMRQNRWFLLLLLLWPWLFGALIILGSQSRFQEFGEILVQEALYGIAIAGFSATAALHNERRSRRMAGVLAKAVSRRQYLAGFHAGIVSMILGFTASIWLVTRIAASVLHGAAADLLLYVLTIAVTAAWVAGMGLMLATFMHPIFATAGMALAAGLPLLAYRHAAEGWAALLPTLPLVAALIHSPVAGSWTVSSVALLAAILECAIFIWIGGWILHRQDVTVAVE